MKIEVSDSLASLPMAGCCFLLGWWFLHEVHEVLPRARTREAGNFPC